MSNFYEICKVQKCILITSDKTNLCCKLTKSWKRINDEFSFSTTIKDNTIEKSEKSDNDNFYWIDLFLPKFSLSARFIFLSVYFILLSFFLPFYFSSRQIYFVRDSDCLFTDQHQYRMGKFTYILHYKRKR